MPTPKVYLKQWTGQCHSASYWQIGKTSSSELDLTEPELTSADEIVLLHAGGEAICCGGILCYPSLGIGCCGWSQGQSKSTDCDRNAAPHPQTLPLQSQGLEGAKRHSIDND